MVVGALCGQGELHSTLQGESESFVKEDRLVLIPFSGRGNTAVPVHFNPNCLFVE